LTLPKNLLTTNRVARVLRRTYRTDIRPVYRDGVATSRTHRSSFAGNSPTYLIVGAQKGGTTALFEALVSRPGFGRPLAKEVHYFDRFAEKPPRWYQAHFWGSSDLKWGEATPEYFDTPGVPARIHALIPSAQIIVSLRDPVARAVSHYHHAVDMGHEIRTFDAAIDDELETLRGAAWPDATQRWRTGYITRSRYADSFDGWLRTFPAHQILTVVAERPGESLRSVLDFLGQTTATLESPTWVNQRAYPPASEETLHKIRAALADDTERLPALLGWTALPTEWSRPN
jgi:hypothetical protein